MARRDRWLLLAGAVIVVVAVYSRSIANGAAWDDFGQVMGNPYLTSVRGLVSLFTHTLWETTRTGLHTDYYRPLTMLTYAIDRAIGGDSPAAFHAGNVVIVGLNTALFAAAIGGATNRPMLGIAIALLRALAPINTECVAWISGRFDLLSVTFTIAALLLAQRGRLLWAVFAMACGILAKETTYFCAPFIVLYGAWICRAPARSWIRAAVATVAVLIGDALLRAAVGVHGAGYLQAFKIERFVRSYAFSGLLFGKLTLVPTGLDVFHVTRLPSISVALAFVVSVVASIALLFVLWRRTRKPGAALAVWGVALWAVCLVPPSIACALFDATGERYAGMPNVGLYVAVAGLLDMLLAWRPRLVRVLVPVAALISAGEATLTWSRIADWRDERTLYEASLHLDPNNPRALTALAFVLVREKSYDAAEPLLARAVAHSRRPWRALTCLCFIRLQHNQLDEAESLCLDALRLYPEHYDAWMHLAAVRASRRDWSGALAAADSALAQATTAEALYTKAVALANLRREEEASSVVERALAMQPDHAGAARLAEQLRERH